MLISLALPSFSTIIDTVMLDNYLKQIGSIHQLMPTCMTQYYQHIAIEYLLLLETQHKDRSEQLIDYGLQQQLQRYLDQHPQKHPNQLITHSQTEITREHTKEKPLTIHDLFSKNDYQRYLDSLLLGLSETQQALKLSAERIKYHVKSLRNTQAMDVFLYALQASRKMRAALDLPAPQARNELLKAAKLFEKSLTINDFDALAYFQLGWLSLWMLNQADKAKTCFQQAITLSAASGDVYLHVFALRHLAFAHVCEKAYTKAVEVIEQARQHTHQEHILVEYEYLCYALYAQQINKVEVHFAHLANQHPLYYFLLQCEPAYQRQTQLHYLPKKIYDERILTIRQAIDQQWENNPMRDIRMEEGCNVNRVYSRTAQQHIEKIQQLPFSQLSTAQTAVSEKIFNHTQEIIAVEIDKRHKYYSQAIEKKRGAYRWLKRLAKFLFISSAYLFSAMLLVGIYLLFDRYYLPGDSGIEGYDWALVTSGLAIVMGFSFILSTFETSQVKKLYAKQKMVADALNKLHKTS
ncbi:MAG: hypothetical protein ACWA5U_03240 [bacterium]